MSDITITGKSPYNLYLTHSKAAGPDKLKPRLLKDQKYLYFKNRCSPKICKYWRYSQRLESSTCCVDIYNIILKIKDRFLRPAFAANSKSTLLSVTIVTVLWQTDIYDILYPLQHGFSKSRSCESQLIESIDDVSRHTEDGKHRHLKNNHLIRLAILYFYIKREFLDVKLFNKQDTSRDNWRWIFDICPHWIWNAPMVSLRSQFISVLCKWHSSQLQHHYTDICRKHHITYLAINSTIDAEHLQKKNL